MDVTAVSYNVSCVSFSMSRIGTSKDPPDATWKCGKSSLLPPGMADQLLKPKRCLEVAL